MMTVVPHLQLLSVLQQVTEYNSQSTSMSTLGAMAEQIIKVDVTDDGKFAKLTDDGQLAKLILHEGKGSLPPLHARCLGAPQPPSQYCVQMWRAPCAV